MRVAIYISARYVLQPRYEECCDYVLRSFVWNRCVLSGGEIRVLSITAIRLVVLRVGSPTIQRVLCYTRVRRVKM
jgi:hypothetical protein